MAKPRENNHEPNEKVACRYRLLTVDIGALLPLLEFDKDKSSNCAALSAEQ